MTEDEEKVHNMKYRCLELVCKTNAPAERLLSLAKEMFAWVTEKKNEDNRI